MHVHYQNKCKFGDTRWHDVIDDVKLIKLDVMKHQTPTDPVTSSV